VDNSK